MRVTPAIVESTWDWLRSVFTFLRAPPSSEIRIVCNKRADVLGEWRVDYPPNGPRYTLTISIIGTGALDDLTRLLVHEMLHAHQTVCNSDSGAQHNAEFSRLWRKCARLAVWDEKRLL